MMIENILFLNVQMYKNVYFLQNGIPKRLSPVHISIFRQIIVFLHLLKINNNPI